MATAGDGAASGDQLNDPKARTEPSARKRQRLEQVALTSRLDLQNRPSEVCNRFDTSLPELMAENAWLKELLASEKERSVSYETRMKQLLSNQYTSRQDEIRVNSTMEEALVANNSKIEVLEKQVAQFECDLASAKKERTLSYETRIKQLLRDLYASRQEEIRVKSTMEEALVAKNIEIEALKKQVACPETNPASAKEQAMVSKNQRKGCDCKNQLCGLPNEVLCGILSALPLKDAVRTSILCKRWGHLWALTPDLRFTETDSSKKLLFLDFMQKACALRGGSAIRVLSLSFSACFPARMEKLISSFVSCGVRELSLSFQPAVDRKEYKFPPSIFECGNLEMLKLEAPCILKLPSYICLSKLKVLILMQVLFVEQDSLDKLCSLSLERLEIMDCKLRTEEYWLDKEVQINGSCLKSFHYNCGLFTKICLSGDTTHLVEATILTRQGWRLDVNLQPAFSTVKELTISDELLQGLVGTDILLFSNLTRLTIDVLHPYMRVTYMIEGLWAMLVRCPHLRSLYFIGGFRHYSMKTSGVALPDQVPCCFLRVQRSFF